jgi:hypothetical protein
MPSPEVGRVVLGPEHDAELRNALMETLRELDGHITDRSWGVAGSQEIERLDLIVNGERVIVEAETYMGLSLSGSAAVVQLIVTALQRRRGATNRN